MILSAYVLTQRSRFSTALDSNEEIADNAPGVTRMFFAPQLTGSWMDFPWMIWC